MRPYPHTPALSAASHHDWTVFGFTAVLRLLASVEPRQVQHTLLQPSLYGIETGPTPLPECAFLHYLRTQPAEPAARLAALKQLAVGLRYTALVGQSIDDVYVETPDAARVHGLRNLRLHMASQGQSVLRVVLDPQPAARPDGGIFIQAGHPLGWFEIGPARALSELAMAVIPRPPIANAAAITPWFLLHRAMDEPATMWSWAPSLASAAADFDVFSAAARCCHPAQ